jgi:hypothetical protein
LHKGHSYPWLRSSGPTQGYRAIIALPRPRGLDTGYGPNPVTLWIVSTPVTLVIELRKEEQLLRSTAPGPSTKSPGCCEPPERDRVLKSDIREQEKPWL